jgi:hypothetical protein
VCCAAKMLLWGTLLLAWVGMLLQGGEAQETNCPETILCDKAGQAHQKPVFLNQVLRLKFSLFHEILLVKKEFLGTFTRFIAFSPKHNDINEAKAFETNFVFLNLILHPL